jgi:hypothetical protein
MDQSKDGSMALSQFMMVDRLIKSSDYFIPKYLKLGETQIVNVSALNAPRGIPSEFIDEQLVDNVIQREISMFSFRGLTKKSKRWRQFFIVGKKEQQIQDDIDECIRTSDKVKELFIVCYPWGYYRPASGHWNKVEFEKVHPLLTDDKEKEGFVDYLRLNAIQKMMYYPLTGQKIIDSTQPASKQITPKTSPYNQYMEGYTLDNTTGVWEKDDDDPYSYPTSRTLYTTVKDKPGNVSIISLVQKEGKFVEEERTVIYPNKEHLPTYKRTIEV